MAATTLAKIMIDMPLPMPRWVMSSASHMTKAVPAVRISTMKTARQIESWGSGRRLEPRRPAPPLWKT